MVFSAIRRTYAWKSAVTAALLFFVVICGRASGETKIQSKSPKYSVREGESLAKILLDIAHASGIEKAPVFGKSGLLARTKKLNPKIENVNLIYPGQTLILPHMGNRPEGPIDFVKKERSEPTPIPPLKTPKVEKPKVTNPPAQSDPPVAEKSSEPSTPFFGASEFRLDLGASNSTLTENLAGRQTNTGNQFGLPFAELSFSQRFSGSGEYELKGRYTKPSSVVGVSFPNRFGGAITVYRNGFFPGSLFGQGLDLGIRAESIETFQATPDLITASPSGGTIQGVRSNHLYPASLLFRMGFGDRPAKHRWLIGIGAVVSGKSEAPANATVVAGTLKGYSFLTQLDFEFWKGVSSSLGATGYLRRISLSNGDANIRMNSSEIGFGLTLKFFP